MGCFGGGLHPFCERFGIDPTGEQYRSQSKEKSKYRTVGGDTFWGFLDSCAQRYGWENVMHKISFQNLHAMMSDRVESVETGDESDVEIKPGEGIHITDYLKKKHVG